MDINLFRKSLASKQGLLNEAVPSGIQQYKRDRDAHGTHNISYGTAHSAGSDVGAHPAVKQYRTHVTSTMPTGDKKSNYAVVQALRELPKDVIAKVAKDFGLEPGEVSSIYRAYTSD